ncbi:F-box protein SKIP23-like [Nicotiana tabacum]|uniref:F-box protein SKIP23-like n=2 Tax=Nicotiana TaxID=4085 RepID=A0A1S3XW81_TOBAC|nr:PREDICTED: F-box protein SKIP23-like [Nicotiana sylvestris]
MNERRTKTNLYSWPKWADLPDELLVKICKCLKYSFQVGNFRAVCTSWRSTVPPPSCKKLSSGSAAITTEPTKKPHRKYIRRLVYRLELQQLPPSSSSSSSPPSSYLIAVEEHYGEDGQSQLRLLNPITGTPISSTPSNFPKEIHLNKFRVSVLHKSTLFWHDTNDYRSNKVVCLPAGGRTCNGRNGKAVAILTKSGKLYLFTREPRVNVELNELMDRPLTNHNLDKPVYHDVVKYKNKLFAIDQYGRGVIVDSSLNVSLVTNPLFLPTRDDFFGNHKSYLVRTSRDTDLFLVDRYLDKSSVQTKYEQYCTSDVTKEAVYDMAVRFRVYKLDEEEHSWRKVTSLNDQVIFVGDDASFWSYCVSAKDFTGCRGNMIFFKDQFRRAENGDFHDFWDALKHEKGYSLGGFHMENAFLGPMACFPGYTDFFWPPPSWLN